MKKYLFQQRSQIWFRIGLNNQKSIADSKDIYIKVLCDIRCHSMMSDVRKDIEIHVFGISMEFLIT